MLCPNCKQEMPDGNKCPHCKVDVVVYKKITRLSDALYNKGLALAKVSDLTGAVSYLEKSIKINKDNVQAYNLLGIVQFELGHVGDAVKQWVISSNRFHEGNPASQYIEELGKQGTTLEKYNDAISKYNGAINYLKQKSDDLAALQLKRVLEINPKFVDAINLLTFCCLVGNDKETASQLVEEALSIDTQNPIALNYHNELHPGRKPSRKTPGAAKPVVTRATPPVTPVYKPPQVNEKKPLNFHFAAIITFIVGAACIFSVYNWMVIPAVQRESAQTRDQIQLDASTAEQGYLTRINEKDLEISRLKEQINELESAAEEDARAYELLLNTNRVIQAYDMYVDGRWQEAVDQAGTIDITGQPPDIAELHQSIFTLANPLLGQMYFDNGSDAFGAEDYAKARLDFERAADYAPEGASYTADLIYMLGMTYAQDENTKEQAIEYLNTLIQGYPNYRYLSRARNMINNLT